MTRNQIVFFLGVLVAGTQFLGIPYDWKNILYIVIGAVLVGLSILVYTRERHLFPKTPRVIPPAPPSNPSKHLAQHNQPSQSYDGNTQIAQ